MERLRRWITSAYHLNMVSPFLAPDVVAATFALTPEQKRDRLLHAGLLERFVPEWAQIPYVSRRSGPSTATRIWDGDGLPAVHELLDTTGGDLVRLLRRDAIERAVVACARGNGTVGDEKALQQFACLAAAAQRLEPDAVRPPTRRYAAFLAASPARRQRRVPAVVSVLATRLSFVKRTRAGRLLWDAARRRLTASP
jgi:asparagine synthase (glutamine-hydrolysing)